VSGRVSEPSSPTGSRGPAASTNGEAPAKRVADITDIASFPTQPPGRASATVADAPIAAVRVAEPATDRALPPTGTISGIAYGPSPSIGQIQARWGEFRRACEDRQSLAVVLETLRPAEITGGTIRLYVENEAQRTMLGRNRDVLAERLTSFFGAPLTIEAVIGVAPAIRAESGPANAGREQIEHPFIRGIVEHLGASPL
jgi:hypothetical protein